MAKSREPDQPDEPDEPEPEPEPEPDEARKRFLAGETRWRDYTEQDG